MGTQLIRLSMYNLRNYNCLLNTPIPTFLLIEEKYKIKTRFKTFLDQHFPDNTKVMYVSASSQFIVSH